MYASGISEENAKETIWSVNNWEYSPNHDYHDQELKKLGKYQVRQIQNKSHLVTS